MNIIINGRSMGGKPRTHRYPTPALDWWREHPEATPAEFRQRFGFSRQHVHELRKRLAAEGDMEKNGCTST